MKTRYSLSCVLLLIAFTISAQEQDSSVIYYEKIQSHFHVDQKAYRDEIGKLLKYAERRKDSVAYARAYHTLGIYYQENGEYDSALFFQFKARRLFNKQNNAQFEAASLNNLCNIYKGKAEFSKAIEYGIQAMKLADEADNVRARVYARTNTGESYYMMGDTKNAQPLFEEAYKIATENNEDELAADASIYLGNLYLGKGDLDGGLQAYQRAYQVKLKLKRYIDIDAILLNIGTVYFFKGDLNKAVEYYLDAIRYSKQVKRVSQEVLGKGNVGEAYGELKNYRLAHIYLDSAIQLAKKIGNKNYVSTYAATQKMIYEREGNMSGALKALEMSYIYKDSSINEANNRHIAELQENYQAEKRSKEIESLSQQNTIQQLSISRQRLYFAGGVVILLLAGFSGWQFQRSRRYKEKMQLETKLKEEQDKAAHAIIETELNERRRIAAELHDGVVQTFSAAKMNLSGITGSVNFTNQAHQKVYENTMAMIDEGCSELRTISHTMMPEVLLKKGLTEALRELVNRIDQKSIDINLGVYGLHQRLSPGIETSVYRIVQESLNNTIKHANATSMDIQLSLDDDRLNLTIEDNGKGFDTAQVSKAGIGLRNITSRVNLLLGKIDIDSSEGKGTLLAISLPVGKK